MTSAEQILSDFRQGRLNLAQLHQQADPTFNGWVTLHDWTVQGSPGQLSTTVVVAPSTGYSILLLITGTMSVDQTVTYGMQIASVPKGSSIAGPLTAYAWTMLPDSTPATVTSAVMGILEGPDQAVNVFAFQQNFTL